jgi:HJR/Mrr/RecB family endonuclease
LIQCKYWHTEKIGPSVVREMLGSLQTFPSGSRGVIVTSTELSEPARDLAIKHGIQFIEQVNLDKNITWTL